MHLRIDVVNRSTVSQKKPVEIVDGCVNGEVLHLFIRCLGQKKIAPCYDLRLCSSKPCAYTFKQCKDTLCKSSY